ncbi:hypothetical protein N8783_03905 [Alphaproteobacteria bacterium]|nr:hypothetical protein [Alphaproteobacteria bacterium]
MSKNWTILLAIVFWIPALTLNYFAISAYPGEKFVYIIFSLTLHFFLLSGFCCKPLFFEKFLSIFCWMGFWFKLSLQLAGLQVNTHHPLWNIVNTQYLAKSILISQKNINHLDSALILATLCFGSLITASLVRRWFYKNEYRLFSGQHLWLSKIHQSNRAVFIAILMGAILCVCGFNYYLGLYSLGEYGTSNNIEVIARLVFKWLILFGLASFVSVFIHLESAYFKKTTIICVLLALFVTLAPSASANSRVGFLTLVTLFLGWLATRPPESKPINIAKLSLVIITTAGLSLASVAVVNFIRHETFSEAAKIPLQGTSNELDAKSVGQIRTTPSLNSLAHRLEVASIPVVRSTLALFGERWIGITELIDVVKSETGESGFYTRSWNQKWGSKEFTAYEQTIGKSMATKASRSRFDFMTSPGMIAYLAFSQSILLMCLGCIVFFFASALFEVLFLKYSGGLVITSALFSQILAYRFVHFGTYPSQTYLLIIAIVVNAAIICFLVKRKTRS